MIQSNPYELARLRKVASFVNGRSVLDVGYAEFPNPYLSSFYRVGYDLIKPKFNESRYDEEIQGDANVIETALHGRKFDTIICSELIEHLENPYRFLRGTRQLLHDSGTLILTTPNPLGFPVFFCELFKLRRFFYTESHLYYFLPRWMARMLNFTGFDLRKIRPVGLWLPFGCLPIWPSILSYQLIYIATKSTRSS